MENSKLEKDENLNLTENATLIGGIINFNLLSNRI